TALSPSGRRADPARLSSFFYIFDRLSCIEKTADGLASLILRSLGRRRFASLTGLSRREALD
ncbi:MAG: hypothetical protein IT182_13925, partial [Acidobacteria bacterium]|nr:hypothetical protein [Acidobacteriota bacterium]